MKNPHFSPFFAHFRPFFFKKPLFPTIFHLFFDHFPIKNPFFQPFFTFFSIIFLSKTPHFPNKNPIFLIKTPFFRSYTVAFDTISHLVDLHEDVEGWQRLVRRE
jgi:hypothetical protein